MFDLALCHRVVRCPVDIIDMPAIQVILQIFGKVTETVVGKQAGAKKHIHPIHASFPQGHLKRLLHIRNVHGGRKLPSQDEAGVIIQDR